MPGEDILKNFLEVALAASTVTDIETALGSLVGELGERLQFVPVGGRENNRGVIEVATDPGRCLIERVTNASDAVLEREHYERNGLPECKSPRDAAQAWLHVPPAGLSGMTSTQRRTLAQDIVVRVSEGEGKNSRTVGVRDNGIGVTADDMPTTILSLNESNKIKKRYLAGTYGQGGSSTFAVSKYTLIVSRRDGSDEIAVTLVKFLDLPPDDFKTGHYVYAKVDGKVISVGATGFDFPKGTLIRHFGYDLSNYNGAFDPGSVYGLLNRYLFDPIISLTFQNDVAKWNRTIKGSRNSLNGAVDDGDDAKGIGMAHAMPTHTIQLGDLGSIGFEYWLLNHSEKEKSPIRSYVDQNHPIIMTNNGQNQGDLTQRVIKKDVGLPYLVGRLICHINCDGLSADAKRKLFTSTREQTRSGFVFDRIVEEIVASLTSDDELKRHNDEARERSLKSRDEQSEAQMRKEVGRLLKIHGVGVGVETTQPKTGKEGTAPGGGGGGGGGGGTPKTPTPITVNDPPTFVRIVWDAEKPITFYESSRRYIRIETDANSDYHDPINPKNSRFNFIVGSHLKVVGSTALKGGRMRLILDCKEGNAIGETGKITVELSRQGQPMLTAQHPYAIVEKPPVKMNKDKATVPNFNVISVAGPDDENWARFPEGIKADKIASAAVMDEGTLDIYYSAAFPRFHAEMEHLAAKDTALAATFKSRYEIWLAVHSLLHYQDSELESCPAGLEKLTEEEKDVLEQEERVRIATVAALMAKRETTLGAVSDDS